jgi:hypothetical protein
MSRTLLCKIVIMIVQEVYVSKLGLQQGGSEEKPTQLVSNKSLEDQNPMRNFDALALDLS